VAWRQLTWQQLHLHLAITVRRMPQAPKWMG
jgi:hypothetical protein